MPVSARTCSEKRRLKTKCETVESTAERERWHWQPDHVFTDAGGSGTSIEGRASLEAPLTAATARPFDVPLVDDLSGVARKA